jgi:hypothetical protein
VAAIWAVLYALDPTKDVPVFAFRRAAMDAQAVEISKLLLLIALLKSQTTAGVTSGLAKQGLPNTVTLLE